MPGSRRQEIKSHLSLINKTVKSLSQELHDFQYEIVLPSHLKYEFSRKIRLNSNTIISNEMSHQLMSSSLAGLIKTGTSNLEAALLGLPFSMFYKTSFMTYLIGKKVINLPYLSIVNIISMIILFLN